MTQTIYNDSTKWIPLMSEFNNKFDKNGDSPAGVPIYTEMLPSFIDNNKPTIKIISKLKKTIIKIGMIFLGYLLFLSLLPIAKKMLWNDPYSILNVFFLVGIWMYFVALNLVVLIKFFLPATKFVFNKWLIYKNKKMDIGIALLLIYSFVISCYYVVLMRNIMVQSITASIIGIIVVFIVTLIVKYERR